MTFLKTLSGLLLVLNLSTSVSVQAQETVRLTNGDWKPWLSEELEHSGVVSHIVTEAFALQGIEVEYEFYPWKRGYKLAAKGKFDGSVVWSRKHAREAEFYYSEPVFSDEKVFFHLNSFAFSWNTMDDLEQVVIGATLGYAYGNDFDEADKAKKIKVQRVPNDETNIKNLLAGRIQVFPCNRGVGYELINGLSADQAQLLTHNTKTLSSKPYHLIVSRALGEKGQHIINEFNKGLAKLRESGKLAEYFAASDSGEYTVSISQCTSCLPGRP
jgi:polar amino acid transport system substrate-binding protein